MFLGGKEGKKTKLHSHSSCLFCFFLALVLENVAPWQQRVSGPVPGSPSSWLHRNEGKNSGAVINNSTFLTLLAIKYHLKSVHRWSAELPHFIKVTLFAFKVRFCFHRCSLWCRNSRDQHNTCQSPHPRHGHDPHDRDHAQWDNLMLFFGDFSPQIDPLWTG